MRRIILIVLLALSPSIGLAQGFTYPALSTPNEFSNTNQFDVGIQLGPVTFSSLPAAPNPGTIIYCADCQTTSPCLAGGPGAFAQYSGSWACTVAGSGGGGGIISVSGTINQILSSGGLGPILSFPTTVIFPGSATATTFLSAPILSSTVAIGTPPLTVTSTTVVPNLNASLLLGTSWGAPGPIGSGTPSTGAFTTLSASAQISSTVSTGTAPFSIASTTVVPNLNVSQLLGNTWAIPGAIGATTPAAGSFTTLGATGAITSTLATGTAPFSITSTTPVANLSLSGGAGTSIAGFPSISGTNGIFTNLSSSSYSGTGAGASIGSGTTANTDLIGFLNYSTATTALYAFAGNYNVHPECWMEPQFDMGSGNRHWISYSGVAPSFTATFHFGAAVTGSITYGCFNKT